MVDYSRLDARPDEVMAEVASFLDVDPTFQFQTDVVMNTRVNRGVHSAGSKAKIGGVITAVAKESLKAGPHKSLEWRERLLPYATENLNRYFAAPNVELQALLMETGHRAMTWCDPQSGLPSADYALRPSALKERRARARKEEALLRSQASKTKQPQDPF